MGQAEARNMIERSQRLLQGVILLHDNTFAHTA